MKLILQIKLLPDDGQAQSLFDTIKKANSALDFPYCFLLGD